MFVDAGERAKHLPIRPHLVLTNSVQAPSLPPNHNDATLMTLLVGEGRLARPILPAETPLYATFKVWENMLKSNVSAPMLSFRTLPQHLWVLSFEAYQQGTLARNRVDFSLDAVIFINRANARIHAFARPESDTAMSSQSLSRFHSFQSILVVHGANVLHATYANSYQIGAWLGHHSGAHLLQIKFLLTSQCSSSWYV